jgi:hypothetical protein
MQIVKPSQSHPMTMNSNARIVRLLENVVVSLADNALGVSVKWTA